MILDKFKLDSLVMQVSYPPAFEIWDYAGGIASSLNALWGPLRISDANPQHQTLVGEDVAVSTSFEHGILNLFRAKAESSSSIPLLQQTYDIWRDSLSFERITRLSARSLYAREFKSLAEANKFVLDRGLIRWPDCRVFNQDEDSELNGLDVAMRLEDGAGFTVVRIKAERVMFRAELDRAFVQDDIRVEKTRVVIDFDRGLTKSMPSAEVRIGEWFKGYQHVLRRDLPK